jgi:PAS domain S-box-containing protein
MQAQKVIEQLGYSAKEAKVYLTALALGEAHITDIASKVKMPRSSVQVIADKLQKDGLMTFYVMRRYKYWVAENPEHLLKNLQKREEVIRLAIPELTAIKNANRSTRQKERNFEKNLAVLRSIADTSPQPVLITNSDVEILYVNTIWEKQFGYSLDEIRGKNPRVFRSGKTPNSVYVDMWKALETGGFFQSDAITDKRKDGTHFNLMTTIFPLKYGNRTYYVQILDEINKSKHTNDLRSKFLQSTDV